MIGDSSVESRREADRLIDRGNVLEDAGDIAMALERYRDAAAAAPHYARAHMNVGNALRALNRLDEAISATRKASQCDPASPRPRFNLAAALRAAGDNAGAETQLREALRLDPTLVDAHVALADVLEAQERISEAQAELQRVLTEHPNSSSVAINLLQLLVRHGRHDEAEQWLLRTTERAPVVADQAREGFLKWLNATEDVDRTTVFRTHAWVARSIECAAGPRSEDWPNEPDPDRSLRIGYVSGDFRHHPVALFMRPVLAQHDADRYPVHCYSTFGEPNPIAEVLRQLADRWHDVSHMDDRGVADLIRADAIDVLVDLSGHTAHNRLRVLARRAAPVQATWLGYLNTTGLAAIDYRICDGYTDPPGASEAFHSEHLFRMPHSQWCYAPWYDVPLDESLRRTGTDSVMFGSFNQYWKITDGCLDLWSRILHAVPGSRLAIMDVIDPSRRRALREKLAARGIGEDRALLRGREDIIAYFRSIASVDVALDSFPYNGATTTLDTLWMGTPIVGLAGNRGVSRGTLSILKSVGADELIANDPDSYVELNVRLANDAAWRQTLHAALRPRLAASPLMDASQFSRDLEAGYRWMWRRWCQAVASRR